MQPVTITMGTSNATQSHSGVRNHFANSVHALLDLVDRFNLPKGEEEEQKGRLPSFRVPQGQGEILSASLTAWSRTFVREIMNEIRVRPIKIIERLQEWVRPYFNNLNEITRDALHSALSNSRPVAIRNFVVDGDIWDRDVHARCYVLFRGISPNHQIRAVRTQLNEEPKRQLLIINEKVMIFINKIKEWLNDEINRHPHYKENTCRDIDGVTELKRISYWVRYYQTDYK